MTRYGTAYFPSLGDACRYYAAYAEGEKIKVYVNRLLDEGAIHIGKPEIKQGERLVLVDDNRRYAIEA